MVEKDDGFDLVVDQSLSLHFLLSFVFADLEIWHQLSTKRNNYALNMLFA